MGSLVMNNPLLCKTETLAQGLVNRHLDRAWPAGPAASAPEFVANDSSAGVVISDDDG